MHMILHYMPYLKLINLLFIDYVDCLDVLHAVCNRSLSLLYRIEVALVVSDRFKTEQLSMKTTMVTKTSSTYLCHNYN